jgi:hypothetical protein
MCQSKPIMDKAVFESIFNAFKQIVPQVNFWEFRDEKACKVYD